MFEITEEPKKKVKIMGKEYELTPPTAAQSLALQVMLDENVGSNSAALKGMMNMFIDAGLPKEVCESIPSRQLGPLTEYLLGSKKN